MTQHHTPQDLLSIGAFSSLTGLSISATRFYCDRGLLQPAEIDRSTGYRKFHPTQVAAGQLVCSCRLMKMSLDQIAAMLKADPAERHVLIQHHLDELEEDLARIRDHATIFDRAHERAGGTSVSVTAKALRTALSHVLTTAGTDPARPDFMVVRIEVRDASLRLAATDSHRLAVRDLVPQALGAPFVCHIAADTAAAWRDELLAADGLIDLEHDGSTITMLHGESRCDAVEVAVTFPDYEPVLSPPSTVSSSIVTNQAALRSALEHCQGTGVDVSTTEHELLLADTGTSHGPAQAGSHSLSANITGERCRFRINRDYMLDAVDSVDEGEVVIETRSNDEAVVIRSADDGVRATMIMPILENAS